MALYTVKKTKKYGKNTIFIVIRIPNLGNQLQPGAENFLKKPRQYNLSLVPEKLIVISNRFKKSEINSKIRFILNTSGAIFPFLKNEQFYRQLIAVIWVLMKKTDLWVR